jgi:hypothetical protein
LRYWTVRSIWRHPRPAESATEYVKVVVYDYAADLLGSATAVIE